MSTFVLRREYALQMPNNFVDVDMDEMEYVDGGGAVSNWFFSTKTVGAALNTAIGYAIPVASVASYIRSAGQQVAQKFLMGVVQRKLTGWVCWSGCNFCNELFRCRKCYSKLARFKR